MPGYLTGPVTGFQDRMKGKGMCSSSFVQQIGSSAALAAGAGNIAALVSPGVNPGATNVDSVLAAWTIPANLFDVAGRGVQITAMGGVANNTNSKRIKIIWSPSTAVVGSTVGSGGPVIADTGAYTTAGAAGFQIMAQVFKYGAKGSNTQIALHQGAVIGATNGALTSPAALTSTESGTILVAITGNAVTTATDIALNFAELFATN